MCSNKPAGYPQLPYKHFVLQHIILHRKFVIDFGVLLDHGRVCTCFFNGNATAKTRNL